MPQIILLLACFAVFLNKLTYHRPPPASALAHRVRDLSCIRCYRVVDAYIRLSTLLVVVFTCFKPGASWLLALPLRFPAQVVGLGTVILAEAAFIWSMRTLGKHYTPCFDSYLPSGIVTTGPYRYVRHPVYASNILLMIGLSLLTQSVWVLISTAIVGGFYFSAARREEASLRKAFSGYAAYQAHSGMLVPRLRVLRPGG